MSLIMTATGWQRLVPLYHGNGCYNYPNAREPGIVKSIPEEMGLEPNFNAVCDQYCEAIQRYTRLPRNHPNAIDEQRMLSVMGSKRIIPGFHVAGYPK